MPAGRERSRPLQSHPRPRPSPLGQRKSRSRPPGSRCGQRESASRRRGSTAGRPESRPAPSESRDSVQELDTGHGQVADLRRPECNSRRQAADLPRQTANRRRPDPDSCRPERDSRNPARAVRRPVSHFLRPQDNSGGEMRDSPCPEAIFRVGRRSRGALIKMETHDGTKSMGSAGASPYHDKGKIVPRYGHASGSFTRPARNGFSRM